MKRRFLFGFLLILVLALSLIQAPGEVEESQEIDSVVNSIILSGEGDEVEWDVEGYSPSGFKVVWSKNSNPEYPLREGDKYNYHSNPEDDESDLSAFDGSGKYYVRVCEYLGGKCGVYSNQIELVLGDGEEVEENEEDDLIEEEECWVEEICYKGSEGICEEKCSIEEDGQEFCEEICEEKTEPFCEEKKFCGNEKEYEYEYEYEYEKDGVKYNYEYEYEGKKEGFVPIIYGGDQECEGCLIEGECVPIGYRKAGVYCTLGGKLINQSLEGEACDNNFECDSNVCASRECISAGMIQKVLNFFRNLFG